MSSSGIVSTEPLLWALCNSCGQSTKHIIIAARELQKDDELADGVYAKWHHLYQMLECSGCEQVMMKRTEVFADLPAERDIEYYPPRVSRRYPSCFWDLPSKLRVLMHEIYAALNAGSCTLAMIGARTAIDMLAVKSVGDAGTFKQKLAELERLGFLSVQNRTFLDAAIDAAIEAGHASAHRGHQPKADDVCHVLDILENVFQSRYSLGRAAKQLRQVTPARVRNGPLVPAVPAIE